MAGPASGLKYKPCKQLHEAVMATMVQCPIGWYIVVLSKMLSVDVQWES